MVNSEKVRNKIREIKKAVDKFFHIIARKNLELPKSNAEAFAILCRHGILSDEKEKVYMAMARFRNRIVHLYDQVDDREVHRIIRENLHDYSVFIGEVTVFMEREADS